MDVLSALPAAEIPQAIYLWLVSNQEAPGHAAFYGEGTLYLAARLGQRPTGGYSVLLGDLELGEPVVVRVEEKAPTPGAMVIQAITYPWTVARLSCPQQPQAVVFWGRGDSVLAKVAVNKLNIRRGD